VDADYDGIVLGTGHNALVLQAYLARAGLRVLSVDRADVPGGGLAAELGVEVLVAQPAPDVPRGRGVVVGAAGQDVARAVQAGIEPQPGRGWGLHAE
jgi:ribulose 1,5-bisphosphate synthetase/thiazole synthase